MGSPLDQSASFLLEKMWKELRTEIEEIFLMKVDNLMFLIQYLCIFCRDFLFSLVTSPVWDPTSKGVTDTSDAWISLVKCWYLSFFKVLAIWILVSFGTVSSKIFTDLHFLSMMTKSGFRLVTTRLGGRVPLVGVWNPSIST